MYASYTLVDANSIRTLSLLIQQMQQAQSIGDTLWNLFMEIMESTCSPNTNTAISADTAGMRRRILDCIP